MDSSCILLDRGNNTTCQVNLFGATVISWKILGEEQLFVSKKANLDHANPVRGGIQVVFPHFGSWSHRTDNGFARTATWTIQKPPYVLQNQDVEAILTLSDNEATRTMWANAFRLVYRVLLTERGLHCYLTVTNTGSNRFSFTPALQNHLRVEKVKRCVLRGLKGCRYVDKAGKEVAQRVETRDEVVMEGTVDSVYSSTMDTHLLNITKKRSLKIRKYNAPDTVLWSPGKELVRQYEDIHEDESNVMFSLGVGNILDKVSAMPGDDFQIGQILLKMCPCRQRRYDEETPCVNTCP